VTDQRAEIVRHEAGHATLGWLLGLAPRSIHLDPAGESVTYFGQAPTDPLAEAIALAVPGASEYDLRRLGDVAYLLRIDPGTIWHMAASLLEAAAPMVDGLAAELAGRDHLGGEEITRCLADLAGQPVTTRSDR
jgi:hypothetical protein